MTPTEITERFAALETQAQADRDRFSKRLAKSERKLKTTWAISALAAVALFTTGWHKDAIAQGYGMTLAQAATRISALETKTASMSVIAGSDSTNTSGKPTVRFSGVNVQIVDGNGTTNGAQGGLGNLIIGYNELRTGNGAVNNRTGDHNLVAGIYNNYSGNGGVVFGNQNSISKTEATVTGGALNTVIADYASVSGGYGNTASGDTSSISGGDSNTATQYAASVLGGRSNTASGNYSSVSGGAFNTASGVQASVSGGFYSTASGNSSSVSGGYLNKANSLTSSVSGGAGNTASGNSSSVSGGDTRTAPSQLSWVAGTQAVQ